MPEPVKPPTPPMSVPLFLDKEGNLYLHEGFGKWKTRASSTTVHTIDNTGKRVTVTRAVTLGIFAFAAKKKTGDLTMVIARADGDSRTVKVKAKNAQTAIEWAVRFNAWADAQR